ncbi:Unknown protein [Striga hermonthica]|uniref:F-box associated beta-propeller type 1 domain-containing protein n=1 Tax=Striga hermonthica TaxID=68872 RepID=A0A9N7MVU1_STRHE|nr:Unknown protein [Striga hermonthica]
MGMLMGGGFNRAPNHPSFHREIITGRLNSRYFFRNLSSIEHNPSPRYIIPKRHLQIDSTRSSLPEKKKKKLLPLLLRKHGNNMNTDGDVDLRCNYFSVFDGDDKSLSTRQLHLPFSVNIQGYCNGVVCLVDKFVGHRIALWNPSINEFKFLPPTCIQRHPDAKYLMFAGTSTGFDRNSQDIKVVRFVFDIFPEEHYTHPTTHAELYSLKSDSWEELPDSVTSSPWEESLVRVSASVNGVAYRETEINSRVRLLTFDFASKQFSFLDLPDSAKLVGTSYRLHLAEREGKLAAIIYPECTFYPKYNIYPNSETKKKNL